MRPRQPETIGRWTLRPVGDTIECLLDGVKKAVIFRRERSARPWLVMRIWRTADGRETEGGIDSFLRFENAKEFVVNNPTVWGG